MVIYIYPSCESLFGLIRSVYLIDLTILWNNENVVFAWSKEGDYYIPYQIEEKVVQGYKEQRGFKADSIHTRQ